MRIQFYPEALSTFEREVLSIILLDELEVQKWCVVLRSNLLQEEAIIVIQ